MRRQVRAADVVPVDADLPGSGWLAIDEGFGGDGGDGPGAVFDCVGPDFPDAAVVDSASSPHFVRSPATLVHGTGVRFDTEDHAVTAHLILSGSSFAECLGKSVSADLDAGRTDAEVLGVDLVETAYGYRVRFTGGDERGVRPVNLDVASLRIENAVGVLWCGDTPGSFGDDGLAHLLGCIRARTTGSRGNGSGFAPDS